MSEQGGEGSVRKRQRTAMACRSCRVKKSKCDGGHPSCATCREAGRKCEYPLDNGPAGAGKVAVDASYLGDLEAMARLYQMGMGSRAGVSTLQGNDRPAQEQMSTRDSPHSHDQQTRIGVESSTSSGHREQPNTAMESTADFADMWSEQDHYAFDTMTNFISPSNSGLSASAVSADLPLQRAVSQARNEVPSYGSVDLTGHMMSTSNLLPAFTEGSRQTLHSDRLTNPSTQSMTQASEPEDREMDGMGLLPSVVTGTVGTNTSRHPSSHTTTNITGIMSDYEHYGETSGIRFHSVLLEALLPGYQCLIGCEDPSGQQRGSNYPRFGFLGLPLASEDPSASYPAQPQHLPSILEAKNMWGVFSSRIHCLYPFISIDMLSRSYNALLKAVEAWKSSAVSGEESPLRKPIHQPLLALHFCVFALVCAVCPGEFVSVSKDAHMIALKLLRNHQDWPHSTIKTQALLHGVLLLQSVDCPGHSWNLLGYAVRSAYAIGLHQSGNLRGLPALDKEIRCRAWWGCFVFDRLLAVTIGRPPAITVIEPDFPTVEPLRGEQRSSILFFRESINLYSRLSQLITNPPLMAMPNHDDTTSLERTMEATAKLELEYARWRDDIVPELQADIDNDDFCQPLGLALALKGATMRLLLHRPLLLTHIRETARLRTEGPSAINDNQGDDYQRHQSSLSRTKQQVAVGMSLAAVVETAITSVKLMKAGGGGPRALSVPWYQLFYSMNAFMSLIATFLVDLSQFSFFVKTSAADSLNTLNSIHEIVKQIHTSHSRPSSQRALGLMEKVLAVLGLLQNTGNVNGPASLSTSNGAAAKDASGYAAPLDSVMNSTNTDALLPQIDYRELLKLLDLDMGQRPTDMPTADWLGIFGASG